MSAEAMVMRPDVSYISCATYSKGQNGNIITFAQFELGNLLSGTREDAESDDESGDKTDHN